MRTSGQLPAAIYRPLTLAFCIAAALPLGACGKKSAGLGSTGLPPGTLGTVTDGNGTHIASSDPHPADCDQTMPPTPSVTAVAGCATTVGTLQPSEGTCYVLDTVTPEWESEPPSSGPQYGDPTFVEGPHTEPVKRGTWVRNLAHGFVVIAYNCPTDCSADLAAIVAANNGKHYILTPDPLLTVSRFAAISWNYVYTFDTLDPAKLACFVNQHIEHGVTGIGYTKN